MMSYHPIKLFRVIKLKSLITCSVGNCVEKDGEKLELTHC